MKEILAKKRKLKEHEMIKLNEECGAILHNKLPPKLEDPGSFSIPCIIENFKFNNVLCDLGASINLIPLSIFRALGLGELKNTTVLLQLTDRSIKYLLGLLKMCSLKSTSCIFLLTSSC